MELKVQAQVKLAGAFEGTEIPLEIETRENGEALIGVGTGEILVPNVPEFVAALNAYIQATGGTVTKVRPAGVKRKRRTKAEMEAARAAAAAADGAPMDETIAPAPPVTGGETASADILAS